jgi:dihydrolipoamide dehydrogenase
MTSTGALALADVPETLLVVGGGYVGLELGSVYASLGSRVTLVEMADALLPGADPDLVKPLRRRLDNLFEAIRVKTKISRLKENEEAVTVAFAEGGKDLPSTYDRALIAVGRKANSTGLGLKHASVDTDDNGFIRVDEQQRTSNDRVYAVGDITGGMMLAHKATREGKVAAEAIAGQPSAFDVRAIPAVVYTDPQVAWAGITEQQAEAEGISIQVQRFPWKASGRAVTMGLDEGLTKLIVETGTGRILGVGVVGRDAEGLIAEGVLAIEMGALAEDVALTVHPHPTLSETEGEAAEIFHGSPTHIIAPGRRKSS